MLKTNSDIHYDIKNVQIEDIENIQQLYTEAIKLQKRKKEVHWPFFEKEIIEKEIEEKRIWKLIINNEIACTWVTTFEDLDIWREKNNTPSLYLHRITTNIKYRGRKLVSKVIQWSKQFAQENKRFFLRLDTAGINAGLITLYVRNGFKFIGTTVIENTENLPVHYHGAEICLFEMKINVPLQFTFREATNEDIKSLKNLAVKSWSIYKDILEDIHWKNLERILHNENLFKELTQNSYAILCELSSKEIIGMAFLVPQGNPTEVFEKNWSYMRFISVKPEYNGQGIGKKLTQLCIEQAKKTREKFIALHTSEIMPNARKLYENLGFKIVREIDNRLGVRYWLYLIELD